MQWIVFPLILSTTKITKVTKASDFMFSNFVCFVSFVVSISLAFRPRNTTFTQRKARSLARLSISLDGTAAAHAAQHARVQDITDCISHSIKSQNCQHDQQPGVDLILINVASNVITVPFHQSDVFGGPEHPPLMKRVHTRSAPSPWSSPPSETVSQLLGWIEE